MIFLKYLAAVVCILMAVGSLPSLFFLIQIVAAGQSDDLTYFSGKLLAYFLVIVLLIIASVKFLKSARKPAR